MSSRGQQPRSGIDRFIREFDRGLRVLAGVYRSGRPVPGATEEADLDAGERQKAAALMRVNHAGEVCAQALYQGQALTARDAGARAVLEEAAREEEDHLAWSSARIRELEGRPSILTPLWYAGSLAIGTASGLLGDRWNLAFLAETERQVGEHLEGHLERLPVRDTRTREVIAAMREDEEKHRQSALELGAAEMPAPARLAMRLMAKAMTTVAYRL